MPKALIFSDLHIHHHKDSVDRLRDCITVLEWVFESAIKNKCEYIFFLGDLFHERSKIDVRNYLKTFEVFMEYLLLKNNDLKVFLLVGNHDMYHREKWDVTSIKPLSAIPNVTIIERPTQINIEGNLIDWMPYTEDPIRELKEFKESNKENGKILLGHMSVNGAILNTCYGTKADVIVEYDNDMVPVDPNIFQDWKMTFLGHYHAAQVMDYNVEYVGSPLQLSFGEAFQEKHLILLDLDTLEKEYLINDFSPAHVIATPKDIKNETYQLDGNFVLVKYDSLSTKEVFELKQTILTSSDIASLDMKPFDRKVEEDILIIENVQNMLMNIQEQLDNYMKIKGVPDNLDAKKLASIAQICITEPNQ